MTEQNLEKRIHFVLLIMASIVVFVSILDLVLHVFDLIVFILSKL